MTTKPKACKAPAVLTGINPKMTALAAKLASEYARVREMHAADDGSDDAGNAREKIYVNISNLEDKLAEIAATNLEEMRLKARYTDPLDWGHIGDPLAKSIIRDLLAIGGEVPAAKELEESQLARHADDDVVALSIVGGKP
jgi:hypothetical protein